MIVRNGYLMRRTVAGSGRSRENLKAYRGWFMVKSRNNGGYVRLDLVTLPSQLIGQKVVFSMAVVSDEELREHRAPMRHAQPVCAVCGVKFRGEDRIALHDGCWKRVKADLPVVRPHVPVVREERSSRVIGKSRYCLKCSLDFDSFKQSARCPKCTTSLYVVGADHPLARREE